MEATSYQGRNLIWGARSARTRTSSRKRIQSDHDYDRFCPHCNANTSSLFCALDATPTLPSALKHPPLSSKEDGTRKGPALPEGDSPIPADPSRQPKPEGSRSGRGLERLRCGDRVGGVYRLRERIGSGGMGIVFAAVDLQTGREVALKLLKPSELGARADACNLAREARLSQMVHSRFVARTLGFEFDEASGCPFMVMERVRGHSLDELLSRYGPPSFDNAMLIARQVVVALEDIHACGVIHRDLKPKNIIVEGPLSSPGSALIIDFGLACEAAATDDDCTNLELFAGTPPYMSPEQLRGGGVDPRSDMYALGCVLHEMITGEPPNRGEAVIRHRHCGDWPAHRAPSPPSNVNRYAWLEMRKLLEHLLEPSIDKRPSSAGAVRRVLDRVVGLIRESRKSSELEGGLSGTAICPSVRSVLWSDSSESKPWIWTQAQNRSWSTGPSTDPTSTFAPCWTTSHRPFRQSWFATCPPGTPEMASPSSVRGATSFSRRW